MAGRCWPGWQIEELPVLITYWSQWFEEMGVDRYQIERIQNSGRLMKGMITDFMSQPGQQNVQTAVARPK